jgi:hypothetical protein
MLKAIRRASSRAAERRRAHYRVLLLFSLVLKRERHAGAERSDLPIVNFHIHLGDLGHAQITQRAGDCLHRLDTGILPRCLADADDIDNAINAI